MRRLKHATPEEEELTAETWRAQQEGNLSAGAGDEEGEVVFLLAAAFIPGAS